MISSSQVLQLSWSGAVKSCRCHDQQLSSLPAAMIRSCQVLHLPWSAAVKSYSCCDQQLPCLTVALISSCQVLQLAWSSSFQFLLLSWWYDVKSWSWHNSRCHDQQLSSLTAFVISSSQVFQLVASEKFCCSFIYIKLNSARKWNPASCFISCMCYCFVILLTYF